MHSILSLMFSQTIIEISDRISIDFLHSNHQIYWTDLKRNIEISPYIEDPMSNQFSRLKDWNMQCLQNVAAERWLGFTGHVFRVSDILRENGNLGRLRVIWRSSIKWTSIWWTWIRILSIKRLSLGKNISHWPPYVSSYAWRTK